MVGTAPQREARRRGTTRRAAAVVVVVATALVATACSSTTSEIATTKQSGIPKSAFSDHTGVTSTSVSIGNVSTLTFGLFKGALVGTEAYAKYVNSQGGVDGRKLVVNGYDDKYSGAGNKQATQQAINSDFALVGSFSLDDSYGGALLAQDPGVPDVSVAIDPKTAALPNVVSAVPLSPGWELGPLEFFKQHYPTGVKAVGALIANQPSAESQWAGEKAAMEHLGYHVTYDQTFDITQSSFDQNVIAMKQAGVKMLFIEQMPYNYAAAVIKAMQNQNYHPVLVLGASTYSSALIPDVVKQTGSTKAVDGAYLDQNTALYLGEDASVIPADATFLHWVQVASPGFKPDLFTLYGWLSAELFTEALRHAGSDPSRGSLLAALQKITSFDGGHLVAPGNPSAKTLSNCYLLGRVVSGTFQRYQDPPVSGPTHGYRCNYSYYRLPGA